jgi:hypothetical protein
MLVGVTEQGVLIALRSDGSNVRALLEPRKQEVRDKLNAQLPAGRRLDDIEFRDDDMQTRTMLELLHAVRADMQALANRVDALEAPA